MGVFCPKFQEENNSLNIAMKEDSLKIINLTKSDIDFWSELNNTGMIALNQITHKSIEFKYKSIDIENLISFGQILDKLFKEQNFFYLIPTIEITLCLIDFIEYVIKLKEKHGKSFFFLIDFSKFYLSRDNKGRFSRLLYLDDKLNDKFDLPRIIINEDKSFFNSITGSFLEGNNKTMLSSLQKKSSQDILTKTIENLDVNSYFYSYSQERYRIIQSNFSFEECDVFYTNCFIDFINSVLFKKVFINVLRFDKAYHDLKRIIRSTLTKKFYESQLGKISLKLLKVILTNFYLNNEEFIDFNNLIRTVFKPDLMDSYSFAITNVTKLNLNPTDTDFILEKVKEFSQSKISIIYGNCQYDTKNVPYHSCHFISEKLFNSKNNKDMCIQCMNQIISEFFSLEENVKNFFYIHELIEELGKTYPNINAKFEDILQYFCIGMDKTIKGELDMIDKIQVKIYQKKYILFDINEINFNSQDIISYDNILNLDIRAKKFYKFKRSESIKIKKINNGIQRVLS